MKGEFEEWRERFCEPKPRKNGKPRRESTKTGNLVRRNLFIDKIAFATRHKSQISLRDIRNVTDEARKEFPMMDDKHFKTKNPTREEMAADIKYSIDVCAERYEWFEKWFGS